MLTLTSPVETWAHPLPAGVKLAALGVATTGLFLITSPVVLAGAGCAVVAIYLAAGNKLP